MRPHLGKRDAILYDVVDMLVPPLLRQWQERRRLYRAVTGQAPARSLPARGSSLLSRGS